VPASLQLSDLFVAADDNTMSWKSRGSTVLLTPIRAFRHEVPVHLYYQVNNGGPRRPVKVAISVSKLVDGVPAGGPLLSVASDAIMTSGISEIRRELDLARMGSGDYELTVVVRDTGDGSQAKQSVSIVVR
jgi:hypothetical protein